MLIESLKSSKSIAMSYTPLSKENLAKAILIEMKNLLQGTHGKKEITSVASAIALFPPDFDPARCSIKIQFCIDCERQHTDEALEAFAKYFADEKAMVQAFFYGHHALVQGDGKDPDEEAAFISGSTPEQQRIALNVPLLMRDGLIDELGDPKIYWNVNSPNDGAFQKVNKFWRLYTQALQRSQEQMLDCRKSSKVVA